MKKLFLHLLAVVCAVPVLHAQLTLDECISLAHENYPLIQKYDLIAKTNEITLSDINKSWLPAVGLYAQGTVQNVVPSFPDAFAGVMSQAGVELKGLGKTQYKIGVDLGQTIWDGGASSSRRKIERAETAERKAALDEQLYAVNRQVQDLFFGILLIDEQIKQTDITLALLRNNIDRMEAMHRNGTAMQSDVDMLEAQYLSLAQQLTEARSAADAYRRLLGLYVGSDIAGITLTKPDDTMPSDLSSDAPRLRTLDAQLAANEARLSAVEASVMPHIGAFAQAYYGYPGINYFESMLNRNLSFNIVAGIKVTWNIDSFYTKRNSRRRLELASQGIGVDRERFLFDSHLETDSQLSKIEGLRKVMADDGRIVALRESVRRASESQLANGIIDATALLTKIADENHARLNASYHEIQLLQNIYRLKYLLNR